MPVWVLRSLLGLALTALSLTAASTAVAQITPTSAAFLASSTTTLTITSPVATVNCTGVTLAGTTPASESATSIAVSSASFSGCSSTLGSATVTATGGWSIGLPSLSSSPSSGAASLTLPAGSISATLGGGLCTISNTASVLSSGVVWNDGGALNDRSQPPAASITLTRAATLNLTTSCLGATTATVSGAWSVSNSDAPIAFWAAAEKYRTDPNPLRYPDTTARADSTRSSRFYNNTGDDVTIESIEVEGDRVFSVSSGFIIDANSSAPVDVKFSPTAAGDYRAKLKFKDSGGNVIFTLQVSGRGR
ncbi:hypothetical protein Q5424_21535 [Conexibacter sp. JD483]|uniref:hypothetical protein n=1 Tax=unclassified Conexibacter TaxID=2627773 RepID=UPI00271AE9AE|nr:MULTISPECIES: hypothetical protein [unclassified Conexibacter]MDO8189018.1 hypothetical protein [Conexibacter sp. CPCC 205706]MDO8201418.1 hypothetical protein [Conexibacter sp. CPCC 205762]MDR9371695.1 hypothetical protein [Conexibacter sp. JD483]